MNTNKILKLTLVSYFDTSVGKLVSRFVMADYSSGRAVVCYDVFSKIGK